MKRRMIVVTGLIALLSVVFGYFLGLAQSQPPTRSERGGYPLGITQEIGQEIQQYVVERCLDEMLRKSPLPPFETSMERARIKSMFRGYAQPQLAELAETVALGVDGRMPFRERMAVYRDAVRVCGTAFNDM